MRDDPCETRTVALAVAQSQRIYGRSLALLKATEKAIFPPLTAAAGSGSDPAGANRGDEPSSVVVPAASGPETGGSL
jgi:hypothetical protein